jgi:putative redox protein
MEMLLMGMGGCTGVDLISILKKARQKVQDCRVQIEAEREDDYPRTFRKIHLHFILSGTSLSEHQVQRSAIPGKVLRRLNHHGTLRCRSNTFV